MRSSASWHRHEVNEDEDEDDDDDNDVEWGEAREY